MSLSNYPPGVSGNEPEITGDFPVDPHNPWSIFLDSFAPDAPAQWWLENAATVPCQGIYTPMKDKETAQRVANERNAMIPDECVYRRHACVICGEPDLPEE